MCIHYLPQIDFGCITPLIASFTIGVYPTLLKYLFKLFVVSKISGISAEFLILLSNNSPEELRLKNNPIGLSLFLNNSDLRVLIS